MDTKGGKWRGGGGSGVMNWEIGTDMYTLMCIKWITNKNLLYKKKIIHILYASVIPPLNIYSSLMKTYIHTRFIH